MKDHADKDWLKVRRVRCVDTVAVAAMLAAAVFVPVAIWYSGVFP